MWASDMLTVPCSSRRHRCRNRSRAPIAFGQGTIFPDASCPAKSVGCLQERAQSYRPAAAQTSPRRLENATDNEKTPTQILLLNQEASTEKPAEPSEEERAERDEHRRNENGLANYTRWLAAFTLLLVIVAGVQAGLFVWQLRLMKTGSLDTKVAADAAKESADVSKTTMEANNRPWLKLVITSAGQFVIKDGKAHLRIAYAIDNVGKSPAIAAHFGAFAKVTKPFPYQALMNSEMNTYTAAHPPTWFEVFASDNTQGVYKQAIDLPADGLGEFVFWLAYSFTFPHDAVAFTCIFFSPQKLGSGGKFEDIPLSDPIKIPTDQWQIKVRRRWIC
jgi:hypothetical protein